MTNWSMATSRRVLLEDRSQLGIAPERTDTGAVNKPEERGEQENTQIFIFYDAEISSLVHHLVLWRP